MTRLLSNALNAAEPGFRLGLQKLEAAHGNPSIDIRFTTEILHKSKEKLAELGLDPRDTTPQELHKALEAKLKDDELNLTKHLRTQAATHISAEADVVAGMIHELKRLLDSKRCFALKQSSLKTLLRKLPPKKAMKALGYRSIDSFLKHENPTLILTAAWLLEGGGWQKNLLEQYKKLAVRDFESRSITFMQPTSSRWQKVSHQLVETHKHNLIVFKELGTLVFLPLPSHAPTGSVIASLSLALHELNEIRSASTYLQMRQMQSDFGGAVNYVVRHEPHMSSELLDQPMPWNLIQRYYTYFKHQLSQEIFEPYLHLEEISWHNVESALIKIEPSLKFWHNTSHLAMMDGHKPVTLNLIDVAISFCNKLSYEERSVHYFRQSLWQELMLRYLKPGPVEAAIAAELQPKLAQENVLA